MKQTELFFDDISDALRSVVQALGGYKAVGHKLWPEKAADAAGRLCADCLNTAKPEKLSPDQLMLVLRWGGEAGVHDAMMYIARGCGYEAPKPMSSADEAAALMDRAGELARESRNVAAALERLAARPLAVVSGAGK